MAMYNGGYEVVHMRRALDIFRAWDDYEKRVELLFTRLVPGKENQEKFSQLMGYPGSDCFRTGSDYPSVPYSGWFP